MSAAEQTINDASDSISKIESELDYLRRIVRDRSVRYDNASTAGAELAKAVWEFIEDPAGVGTDALRGAYERFTSQHAGNFWTPPVAA